MALKISKTTKKSILQQLKTQSSPRTQDKIALLETLNTFQNLTIHDIAWMLFATDVLLRKSGEKLVRKIKDPATLNILLREMKGKSASARRNFYTLLPALQLPNLGAKVQELQQNRDPEIREIGHRLLLEMPINKDNFPIFRQLAENGSAEVSLRALVRLCELKNPAIAGICEKLVWSKHEKVKIKAYQYLLSTKDKKYLKLFLEKIVSESPTVKEVLSNGITQLTVNLDSSHIDDILSLLSSGNDILRRTVIKILINMPNRQAVIRHFIEYSRTLLGWVRTRALESMKEFGEDLIVPIIELMDDPDPEIRATALLIGGSFHDPRIVPKVCQLLQDSDWWIRINSAEVLGRIGDAAAVPALLKALQDHEVRWSAIEALGKLRDPRALQEIVHLTKASQPEIRIEAMQALAFFPDKQILNILSEIAQSDPIKGIRIRAFELMKSISAKLQVSVKDEAEIEKAINITTRKKDDPALNQYLIAARQKNASDFHLSVDSPPLIRVDGNLVKFKGNNLTAAQTTAWFEEILEPHQQKQLQEDKQLDFCHYVPNIGRYRANIFLDHKGYNGVFRVIPDQPPTLAEIGIPGQLARVTHYHQGLIIICGPAGSGKSTTLAAFVNLINATKRDHAITLEDPIEFIHPFKNCLINQREVKKHTTSFSTALRAALREDPDVIVIGEMRDTETISLAMTAAETGHVVFCTMNTTTAPKAIDRIITAYPVDEQPQVRMALSETLKIIIAQALLPHFSGKGRVAVFEILMGISALGALIRDDKTYQIPSLMQISRNQGMQTFDQALYDLVNEKKIAPEVAYMRASKKEDFENLVSQEFLKSLLV